MFGHLGSTFWKTNVRFEIRPSKWGTYYNPGQNIWNKIEKPSKTGEDKKSLISTFACFLTATAKA